MPSLQIRLRKGRRLCSSTIVLADCDGRVLAMKRRLCMPKVTAWLLVVLCAAGTARGQGAAAIAAVQTETDEYTRYELLWPESASFAIRYEVTATTAGAKYYFNPISKGSVSSGASVFDAMTGEPQRFGAGWVRDADNTPW